MLCIECNKETGFHLKKLCSRCKVATTIECACGCGEYKLKYAQTARTLRVHLYILGHGKKKYKDRREKNRRSAQIKKVRLLKHLGAECMKCGYSYNGSNAAAFQFHHRDPKMKLFNLRGNDRGYEKMLDEAAKCDLLCANCHSIYHSEEY